jgi:hypothetical protein
MTFNSDQRFSIQTIDKFEGRILKIVSEGQFHRTELSFVLPRVFELPTIFEGISLRTAYPREIDSIKSRIDHRYLNEGIQIIVIETSKKAYFVLCLQVHIFESKSSDHAPV